MLQAKLGEDRTLQSRGRLCVCVIMPKLKRMVPCYKGRREIMGSVDFLKKLLLVADLSFFFFVVFKVIIYSLGEL